MPNRAAKIRPRYAKRNIGPEKIAVNLSGAMKNKRYRVPPKIPEKPGYMAWRRQHALGFAARYALKEYYKFDSGVELKKYYKQIMRGELHHRPWRFVKIMDMLERRLDVFCWKVGYYETLHHARHGIRRGNFLINGRPVHNYRRMLQDGDFLQPQLDKDDKGLFSEKQLRDRIKKRAMIYADPRGYVNEQLRKFGNKMKPRITDMDQLMQLRNYVKRPPAHIPRAHFDFNYTTLTVHYRRSIQGPHDMNDFGDFFGPHMDIMRTWQYYWFSKLCKW